MQRFTKWLHHTHGPDVFYDQRPIFAGRFDRFEYNANSTLAQTALWIDLSVDHLRTCRECRESGMKNDWRTTLMMASACRKAANTVRKLP
jgi:hypothetical protein